MENLESTRSPLLAKWDINELRYSFVWEDFRCLMEAMESLTRAPRRILAIGSSGDNALATLLMNPDEVTIIDLSPAQTLFIEMKMKAIESLSHEEFLNFVWGPEGFHAQGRLDKYFAKFRLQALPHLWSSSEIETMVSTNDLDVQRAIWRRADSRLLGQLATEFFSRTALSKEGREASQFAYVGQENIGPIFLRNFVRLIETDLISRNPYLHYFLTGRPLVGSGGHPLWDPTSFEIIKSRLGAVRLVTRDLESHIAFGVAPYDFMVLSDLFEYLSEDQTEALFERLAGGLSSDGALAYWTLLVDRKPTRSLRLNEDLSARLSAADRTWFYSGFHVAHK